MPGSHNITQFVSATIIQAYFRIQRAAQVDPRLAPGTQQRKAASSTLDAGPERFQAGDPAQAGRLAVVVGQVEGSPQARIGMYPPHQRPVSNSSTIAADPESTMVPNRVVVASRRFSSAVNTGSVRPANPVLAA